ncbi:IS1595 family transposase [Niveibacterium terrae]|uniref:IS1595 family transposase n=1 Tax=Niveibacterium terrae TaxID=3373598 RepID=UPI003A92FA75
MDAQAFRHWLKQASELTPSQKQSLLRMLALPTSPLGKGSAAAPPELPDLPDCPHCHAEAGNLRPWGFTRGLARYRCQCCRRTCTALTGSSLARLQHPDQWSAYAQALIDGLSVRAAAQICGLSKNTSFLWRHRFLALIAEHRDEHEAGIVEAGETFFRESFKGQRHIPRPARQRGGLGRAPDTDAAQIPVLVVRDRSGHTADFKLDRLDAAQLAERLKPLVYADVLLCTDDAAAYADFARAAQLTHVAVREPPGRRSQGGAYHIQNVSAYHGRLQSWMARFHGVATRYLDNYLGWRRMLERYGDSITPQHCLDEALGRGLQHGLGT